MVNKEPMMVGTRKKVVDDESKKYGEAVFLGVMALASLVAGFGFTLSVAKRRDPTMFTKGLFPKMHQPLPEKSTWSELAPPGEESGGQLAMRALKWGTIYAVSGFSAFSYGVWKLVGAKDLQEFRMKVGAMLPVIPKNNPPQGRTEFENLTDLLQYVIDEDERIKQEKKIN